METCLVPVGGTLIKIESLVSDESHSQHDFTKEQLKALDDLELKIQHQLLRLEKIQAANRAFHETLLTVPQVAQFEALVASMQQTLFAVQQELYDLQRGNSEKLGSSLGGSETSEDGDQDSEIRTPGSVNKSTESKSRDARSLRRACATLMRQIAAKTHPDKTPNPDLHVLFRSAVKLREVCDLSGLQAIHDQITGRRRRNKPYTYADMLTSLNSRLANVTHAIKAEQAGGYSSLRNIGETFGLAVASEAATSHLRKILFSTQKKIVETQNAVNALKANSTNPQDSGL